MVCRFADLTLVLLDHLTCPFSEMKGRVGRLVIWRCLQWWCVPTQILWQACACLGKLSCCLLGHLEVMLREKWEAGGAHLHAWPPLRSDEK